MTDASPANPRADDEPFRWRFVAPLLVGASLNPLNSSMIATALVGIGTDLEVGPGTTAMLISALYLTSAIAQPTLGKVSTLVGNRRTFIGGMWVLLLAGAIGATAPSFGFLLLSRVLVGAGTSACYPTAMSMIRQRAEDARIGVPTSVMGNLTIAAQLSATFGFPIGGLLVGAFGWRAIFAVNIPAAILTLILTGRGVPSEEPRQREPGLRLATALDIPGIVLFTGAIGGLLIFLANFTEPVWWAGAISLVSTCALFLWERTTSRPLIDVRMLGANRPLQRTYVRSFLVSVANYTALLGLTQWMEESRGFTAAAAGLVLIPLTGMAAILSRIVSSNAWVRLPLVLGGVAQGLAGVLFLTIDHDTSAITLVGTTMLLACYAFGTVGNQSTLYLQSTKDQMPVAAGLFRTANYVGAIFSSAFIAIGFGSSTSDAGLHHLGWDLVAIGTAITLLASFDRSIPAVAR